ncbi:sensor histidine kinase [Microvirga mediterraneensis]|uniref:Blue-light-activated histidine kinase n=1 Tax=Microvirga mediterraneensis TaxID=2754695 RepID=A0A838BRQ3_9HYPH|nr:HWE histidine kinase domain-containing protein [Microvirga mediterraneensis]MBA1158071.1 PAS domain-containing protein [Microvirga mediterraneensis]
MPGIALISPVDLEQLTGDFAASVSEQSKGAPDSALQEALAHTIEAKVQAQLSVVLEGIGDAFYSLDDQWRFSYINRMAESFFGEPRHSMLRRVIWDVFPEAGGTDLRRRYEEVFASGQPLSFDAQAIGRPGHHLEFNVFPYKGGLGVSFRDWTERRCAEEELRERQAQISALADNLPLGMVYQMDNGVGYEGRRFIYVSASCERLNGIPADKVPGDQSLLFNLILPEFREPVYRAQLEAHAQLKPLDIEFAIRHARTGEIRWQRIVDAPRRLPNGKIVWDGIQIDITDQKRAEDHQRLLINELNHRVKNTLATVQSLAAQSFRSVGAQSIDSLPSACASFEERLFALARAHDVLTRENWDGADFSDVLSQACMPYRTDGAECRRIEIGGPDLRISPSMALSFSMILHELFTNALKYGALSNASGRVRISWSTLAGTPGSRLSMRWEEHGGPRVDPPSRKGFGSRLIQDGIARELNGTVALSYDPDGVVCTVDVPLP